MVNVPRSLREFIEILDQQGQLLRISNKIDPKFGIAAVTRKVQEGVNKTLLFENVKDHNIPVVTNVLGSTKRVELAIDVPYEKFFDTWNRKVTRPISPRRVSDGSCKEVKIGRDIDLHDLPILTHGELEPAPYITAGIVVARVPEEETYNLGYSRMMLAEKDTLVCRLVEGTTNRTLLDEATANNKPLEVAVCIGNHPHIAWSGATTLPRSVDHYGFAGALGDAPLDLVQCETVDVEVPAQTEIVLEGEFLPNEWREEGPFADFLGYYTVPRKNHVLKIKCITHKRSPVYQGILAGSKEDQFLQITLAAKVYENVKRVVPTVLDVSLWNLNCIIKIHKTSNEQSQLSILAAFGAQPLQAKFVIVVDEDINIYDPAEVSWAVSTRCRPDTVIIVPNVVGFGGHFAKSKRHYGRLGIDATLPLEAIDAFKRNYYPGEDNVDLDQLLN